MDYQQNIKNIPRVPLGSYPTLLQELSRLGPGPQNYKLWIKRDDMLGGNKVRKLEFFMAEAMANSAQRVITFGAEQSNHSRETAIACRSLGLEPVIIVSSSQKGQIQGNALLNHILGARMIYVDPVKPAPFTPGGPQNIKQLSDVLIASIPAGLLGEKTYIIPVGGYTPLGSLGYVLGFLELFEQCQNRSIRLDYVVTAVGTTGTYCGLLAGAALINRDMKTKIRVIGISVTGNQSQASSEIADRARQTAALIGQDIDIASSDVNIIDDYWQPGYGKPNQAALKAIKLLAQKQGIFLDPVYTSKAMAGLLDLAEKKKFRAKSNIVFLHSGGFPALFAYHDYFTK